MPHGGLTLTQGLVIVVLRQAIDHHLGPTYTVDPITPLYKHYRIILRGKANLIKVTLEVESQCGHV